MTLTEYLESIDPFALEKNFCEDAISRNAVLAALRKNYRSGGRDIDGDYVEGDFDKQLYDDIVTLPLVTPQPKTGHWLFDDKCKEHGHCPYCGYGSVDLVDGEPHNYCPKCGFCMVESQESEGNNG